MFVEILIFIDWIRLQIHFIQQDEDNLNEIITSIYGIHPNDFHAFNNSCFFMQVEASKSKLRSKWCRTMMERANHSGWFVRCWVTLYDFCWAHCKILLKKSVQVLRKSFMTVEATVEQILDFSKKYSKKHFYVKHQQKFFQIVFLELLGKKLVQTMKTIPNAANYEEYELKQIKKESKQWSKNMWRQHELKMKSFNGWSQKYREQACIVMKKKYLK